MQIVTTTKSLKTVRVSPGFTVRVYVARRQRLLLAKAISTVIRQLDHGKAAA